ncbi:hypothetical protein BKG82_26585 [Mycobacteroides chelonae]|uniref:AbiEi antitoxin N-terminal domain-containing protein n=1 Tax=Mycobacteroides chelonae TaxID=1774 RepID=A0A1S1LGF1_MYCCH|nr:type IV toxin-antitoxin system AbiEi family antitoxin domain-containing protein [Mycobacteroides chelonae]OHU47225.1 hypothetical protein BKG82_26585 [Mycobacteroides chelonae]
MAGQERYLELADIAAGQWGMVTAAQAATVNVTAQQLTRLAGRGMLHRLQHGVYRLAGVPNDTQADLKAAWLAIEPAVTAGERLENSDPGAIVSHRSAARVHRLGDIDADINEFSTTVTRRSRQPSLRFHKRTLPRADWTVIDGLPVTTVAATLRDLAATSTDGGHLAVAVRDALLHGQVRYAEVAALLRPYAADYGAPLGGGEALLRMFLEQAGLRRVTKVADRLGPEWLREQIDTAGMKFRTAEIIGDVAWRIAAQQELDEFSGTFGNSPQAQP